jgi:hypothetical protein
MALQAQGQLGGQPRVRARSLDAAVRLGVVGRNVSDFVDVPAIKRLETHPLSPEEVRVLVGQLDEAGEPFAPLYVTAAVTGLRQGELLGLRWREVELSGPMPVVRVVCSLEWSRNREDMAVQGAEDETEPAAGGAGGCCGGGAASAVAAAVGDAAPGG